MKEIMTKREVAELLQVSPRQVQKLVAEHKLQASRISHKALRIKKEAVEKFLRQTQV